MASFNLKSNVDFMKLARKQKALLKALGDATAVKMEKDAKANAPWTDRTGNARQTLQGKSEWDNDMFHVMICGNMQYSVYLELAHEKKYAILVPTTEKYKDEFYNNAKKVLGE